MFYTLNNDFFLANFIYIITNIILLTCNINVFFKKFFKRNSNHLQ